MDNMNYMMKAINKDAVFAQLDIVTNGTCYDEGVELFRTNVKGEKVGEYNHDLTFEELCSIAKNMMEERKTRNLTSKECGEYQGFDIKIISDGGLRSHFEIYVDGQVSDEFAEWKGHDVLEDLN